jgi:hypothetical protein
MLIFRPLKEVKEEIIFGKNMCTSNYRRGTKIYANIETRAGKEKKNKVVLVLRTRASCYKVEQ